MSKSENVALYKYLTRPVSPQQPVAGSERLEEAAPTIRLAKPATKAQEEIAQKVYGKSFQELDSDRRTKIRTGKITMNSGGVNLMGTAERIAYTKKRMQDFVSDFKKERGRLPSQQEVRKIGKFEFGTIKKYVNEGIVEVGKVGATRGLNDPRVIQVNNELKFLDKNKYVQDSFKKGQLPNLNEVAKILGVKDKSVASYRVGQLASTYLGDRKVEGIKPKFKKGAEVIFEQADQEYNRVIRSLADLKIGRSVGEQSTATTKSAMRYTYPEGVSDFYDIDEPAGTVSSARRGTSPYGAFGQIINSELNKGVKNEFDRKKSINEKALQDAIESGSDTEVKSAVKKFNDTVSEYETKLNQDVKPGQKRIKLFKVSLNNPENTVANYPELSDSYKDALQKNYKTRGYAFKIPSDIKPLSQMADELKIEKNVAKLSKAAEKGGPRIYSQFFPFAKETGEFISETASDLLTKGSRAKGTLKLLGGLGAAYGVYDTGVALSEGKSLPETAFRLFGADPVYNMIREYNRLPEEAQEIQKKINAQQSFDVAVDDPLAEGRMQRPTVTPEEQIYLDEQKKMVQQKVAEENQARSEGRAGLVNFVKEKFYQATGQPYSVAFANGGRVQLSEGGKPKDISRRKFLKLTGQAGAVLAALPFLGKFIKPATKAAPEVLEAISRSAENMPEYLINLINKIKMMGESKIIGKMDSPDEFIRYDLGDYELHEGSGGYRLKRVRDRGDAGYEEFEMQVKQDPESGFVEYEEVSARPDGDGKIKDFDFGIEDDVHAEMKKFADEK
jgi:hypothetical protein